MCCYDEFILWLIRDNSFVTTHSSDAKYFAVDVLLRRIHMWIAKSTSWRLIHMWLMHCDSFVTTHSWQLIRIYFMRCQDSFICDSCIAMTHLYFTYEEMTHTYVAVGGEILCTSCVVMTHSYVAFEHIHMWLMTHSYLTHDSLIGIWHGFFLGCYVT